MSIPRGVRQKDDLRPRRYPRLTRSPNLNLGPLNLTPPSVILFFAMNNELLKILYERSFRFDPGCGFTLASGKKSDLYVDSKKTVLSSDGMILTGRAFFKLIKDEDVSAVGGLTLGADPIAMATAMISNLAGAPLDVFIVRKVPKEHGTRRPIEGSVEKGARVIVIDDVVTTGGSTVKAIESAKEAGFVVVGAVALVDREEGGKENVEKHCPLKSVFTRADLLKLHKERGG